MLTANRAFLAEVAAQVRFFVPKRPRGPQQSRSARAADCTEVLPNYWAGARDQSGSLLSASNGRVCRGNSRRRWSSLAHRHFGQTGPAFVRCAWRLCHRTRHTDGAAVRHCRFVRRLHCDRRAHGHDAHPVRPAPAMSVKRLQTHRVQIDRDIGDALCTYCISGSSWPWRRTTRSTSLANDSAASSMSTASRFSCGWWRDRIARP